MQLPRGCGDDKRLEDCMYVPVRTSSRDFATKTGLFLILAGVLLALFALYQLFGTAWVTQRAQKGLENELTEVTQQVQADTVLQNTFTQLETIIVTENIEVTETVETEVSTSPFDDLTAEELSALGAIVYKPQGEAIAQIISPDMGVDSIVVAGTSVADLRKGPGHYSESAALCSTGNAAIAGHRTTYDAPFGDIQNLAFGDEIQINTPYGNCIYMVLDKFIVEPNEHWVVEQDNEWSEAEAAKASEYNMPANRLTLTSCHPRYSAEQRFIVVAQLIETNVPYLPTQEEIAALIAETSTTTVVSEDVTTTETIEREETVETTVTEDVVEEAVDQANTVGDAEGFGTGLDGEGTKELLPAILYGLIFFMVCFRVWEFTHNGWGRGSYTNNEGVFVMEVRNVPPTRVKKNIMDEATGAYLRTEWVTQGGAGKLENVDPRKFKLAVYSIGAIPMLVAMSLWFYRIDLLLPSY